MSSIPQTADNGNCVSDNSPLALFIISQNTGKRLWNEKEQPHENIF